MSKATLYHNPRCSKCRGALELLQARNVDLVIVEYLDAPLDRDVIIAMIRASDSPPAEFIRTGDQAFKDSGLRLSTEPSAEEVADALVQCPVAMQRPVLVIGDKSVIGRPSERVLELL